MGGEYIMGIKTEVNNGKSLDVLSIEQINPSGIPDGHGSKGFEVKLKSNLCLSVLARFTSINRNDTGFYLEDEDTGEIFEIESTYLASNREGKREIFDNINTVLNHYGVFLLPVDLDDLIYSCLSKCESRYGVSVNDFDALKADAFIKFVGGGVPAYDDRDLGLNEVELEELVEFNQDTFQEAMKIARQRT
jgi:hypothetical protein